MRKSKDSSISDWTDFLLPNFQGSTPKKLKNSLWTLTFFSSMCLILFFAVFLRLFHLQIIQGQANRELADGNRIKVKIAHATRGVIFDRNGKILASNAPAFRLKDKLIEREEALELEVKNDPEFAELEVDNVRNYPLGEEFAHVIGYVGQISEEQLKKGEYKNYHPGDRIGQAGIEAQYEEALKGVDGGEIIEVDAEGRKLRTLRKTSPIPGQNLYLTIDGDLQHQAYLMLKDAVVKSGSCCGALVAEDPTSGQILSLLSIPSFDNNQFSDPKGNVEAILNDPHSAVLNRAIGGTYPPGSTYKIISSLAALGGGKITPQTQIEDTGEIFLGPFRFTNWYFTQYGRKEGPVNLVKALQRSNDTYFYRVGEIVSEKGLIEWSRKLKLGGKLDIDLPGEVSGLVPDNEWKKKNFEEVWFPGDTLHMAIGQGYVLMTPLQVLGITSFIAADGKLYQPQLALKVVSDKGKEIRGFESHVLTEDIISLSQIKYIQQGLEQVPKAGGTAWPFFSFPLETAGKTGTAEYGDPKDRTHAWYTAYAPINDPRIALTVLIEGGGEGSTVASPVAKEVLRWYLSEDKRNLVKDINAPVATESARTLGE